MNIKNIRATDATPAAVLITGAGSGIGLEATKALSALPGISVFAAARTSAALELLGAMDSVYPVQLDVTNEQHIDSAFALIGESKLPLVGLVNNAGISSIGPLMDLETQELRRQLEVNVFSLHSITRKFFPYLHSAGGRIVNIGSLSGKIAFPFMGPYAMSKHALEAYSDSLRRELSPLGMEVVLIEPGKIRTPFLDKALALIDTGLADSNPLFKERAEKMARYDAGRAASALDPSAVVDCIIHGMFSPKPKTRYLVVNSKFKTSLMLGMKDRTVDRMFDKL